MRHRSIALSIGIVALICIALIPTVSAFDAALIKPASETTILHPGDQIQIDLTGLGDATVVTYKIVSNDLTITGNTINLPNLEMPFDFANGLTESTITTERIIPSTHAWAVTKAGQGTMYKNGSSTLTTKYNIKKGTYSLTVSGTPTGSTVGINYNVTGTTDDSINAIPDPASLIFTITGVSKGHLTISVPQSSSGFSKTFTIAPVTPTPEPNPNNDPGGGGQQQSQQQQQQQQQRAPQQQIQNVMLNVINNLMQAGGNPTVVDMKYDAQTGTLQSYTIEAGTTGRGGALFTATVNIPAGVVVWTNLWNGQTRTATVTAADLSTFSANYGVNTNGMVTLR